MVIAWQQWAVAADKGFDRPTGFYRVLQWQSSSASAEGLMFFESSAPGTVTRFLIETPGHHHLVLTSTLLVRYGLRREELHDEETGWQAELTKRSDVRAPDFAEYLARVLEEQVPGQERDIAMSLWTTDGLSFSAMVPDRKRPSEEHSEFAKLLKRSRRDVSSRTLPEGVAEALGFLGSAFQVELSYSRGIIEILSEALDISADATTSSWHEVEGKSVNGLELSDSSAIVFASKFPSVDPTNPLPAGTVEVLNQDKRFTDAPDP